MLPHKISLQNSDLLVFRSFYYIARKARGPALNARKKYPKARGSKNAKGQSPKPEKPEKIRPDPALRQRIN